MIAKTFRNIHRILLFILLFLLVYSCSTPIREVTYLNGIKPEKHIPMCHFPDVYKIRPNDQLLSR